LGPLENPVFEAIGFTSRQDVAEQLVTRALEFAPPRTQLRVLDLGCGSGSVAVAAARRREDLHVVALDVAPLNAQAARIEADRAGVGSRVETLCTDYLSWEGRPFDLIVSDSVLYVLPGTDLKLAQRLAVDLAPAGVLLITTPIDSLANRFRIMLRHVWRWMPSIFDRLAFAIARRLYPQFAPNLIADRINYLRVIPVRLYGPGFAETLRQAGLEEVLNEPWESASVAKLTHHLIALRRKG
jgi:SAM-dependent methyltransferase